MVTINRTIKLILTGIVVFSLTLLLPACSSSETTTPQENAHMNNNSSEEKAYTPPVHSATIGGGCFWCIEAVFERIPGILSAISGYAGGSRSNPTYEEVCSGSTGHAEVVQVTYDPGKIEYREILELFWRAHDPTTVNRQGADVGTQYRSIVLYHNEEQKKIAEQMKKELSKDYDRSVVTEIVPLTIFYPAEEYHQDYYDKHSGAGYCQVVIRPKLKKLNLD